MTSLDTHVVEKQSLSQDELQLRAQGHVGELPRQFSFLATLALAFSVTNTWIGYSATFVVPLSAGAGPGVVFCLVAACIACTSIAVGLAELSSAFPSSGGQYHYAFMVAPRKYRAPIAFTTGWLSVLAWLFTTASAAVFIAQSACIIAGLYHPNYVYTQWQVWLIYALLTIIACLLISSLPRQVPAAEQIFLAISLVGMVVAFITVLATSPVKQPASVVFSAWENGTGWPDGIAFLLATGQAMYGFLGTDGATHIAEELPNPGKNVPKVLMLVMAIGAGTSIPWTLGFLFSTNDLEAIASSQLPMLTVLEQATGSLKVATFFTVWIVIIYFGAMVSCLVTSSRLIWAFSRDDGLPYSKVFAKVHPTLNAPVNATILASVFIVLFGLLYIASTTAYNSIVALAILSSNITCVIPQFLVLIRGRQVLPERYFRLSKTVGIICYGFSVAYVSLFTVLFCFPLAIPVTVESLNYVSVVFVGALVFIAGLWGCGKRKKFTGPQIIEGVEIASSTEAADVTISKN